MHALQQALHYQWAGIDEFEMTVGDGKQKLRIEASSWKDVQDALTEAFDELFDEEKDELGDLPMECERLFRSYLRFWKTDEQTYTVATLPDGSPSIEFLVDVPLDNLGLPGIRFKGRIDLLVEDNEYGGLWVWDAKWVRSVPAPDERMMSPQAPLYVWAIREQYGLDVRGFVYNYGRTKAPSEPRILQRGTLSLAKRMDTDQHTYYRAIRALHGKQYKHYLPYYREKLLELKGREAMWFRRERIPVEDERILHALREYAATVRDIQRRETRRDYVPRTYNWNCKFRSGNGCEYHDLCVAEFNGLEIGPLIKHGFVFEGERYGREEDLLSG